MHGVGHAIWAEVNQEVFTGCDTQRRFDTIDARCASAGNCCQSQRTVSPAPHLTLHAHHRRRRGHCRGVAGSARWGDINRSCHFITEITEWERLKKITPRRLGCIDRFGSAASERSDGVWHLVCVWERAINKKKTADDRLMMMNVAPQ